MVTERLGGGDETMNDKVEENMEVIGADGVHIGTVDRVEAERIKLKKGDAHGRHEGHHHFIELGFIAGVEGDKVRLSANADIAVTLEEAPSGKPVSLSCLRPRSPVMTAAALSSREGGSMPQYDLYLDATKPANRPLCRQRLDA
jgi:hypothetical protein